MIGWRQPEVVSFNGNGFVTNTWEQLEQALNTQAPGLRWRLFPYPKFRATRWMASRCDTG
jgi:hypothetical protein